MALSKTYGDLQRQIIDELGDRSDLLASRLSTANSPIKTAIQSAIAKWEREPFYFNEDQTVPLFTTIAGQEDYSSSDAAAIATSPQIWTLRLVDGTNRYTLTKRSMEYIVDVSVSTSSRGQPTDWAYFMERIRLYPIPDAAYAIRASRVAQPDALESDSDTNIWTTDAYDLIRCEATLILARELLQDDGLASRMTVAIYGNPMNPRERSYLSALKDETARRARSRIRPTQF